MDDIRHLRSQFMVMLPHLERALRRQTDAALAEHGELSAAAAVPLVALFRLGDGIRQVQLAEALGIEEPSLTPILHQLCGAGLVQRRPDTRDRRAKTLHLTEGGGIVARRAETTLAEVRARLLDDVDASDLEAALRVFRSMERAVGRNMLPPAQEVTG